MKFAKLKIKFFAIIFTCFSVISIVYLKHTLFIMQKQFSKLKLLKEIKTTEKHQLEVTLRLKIEEFFDNN
jgi:hypothetical protein